MVLRGSVSTISKRIERKPVRFSFLAFLDAFVWTSFLLHPVYCFPSFLPSILCSSKHSFFLSSCHPSRFPYLHFRLPSKLLQNLLNFLLSFLHSKLLFYIEFPSKYPFFWASFQMYVPSNFLLSYVSAFQSLQAWFLLPKLTFTLSSIRSFFFQGSFLPNTISKSDHCPEPMANVKCYKLKMLPTFVMTKLNPALLQHY